MSDIIANAQQLLDGATPAPWEWVGYSVESVGGMVLDFQCITEFGMSGASRAVEVTPEDEELIAAAPELAQALAAERYEYIAEWCDHGVWAPIEMEMFDGTFPNLQAARGYIKVAKTRGPYEDTRIVRRRVSPPEVIDEGL